MHTYYASTQHIRIVYILKTNIYIAFTKKKKETNIYRQQNVTYINTKWHFNVKIRKRKKENIYIVFIC